MRLHLDYETRSECDIKKCGAYKYAAHPSTKILMLGWAVDDEPENLWLPHLSDIPERLFQLLKSGAVTKHAYNAAFERLITRHCLGIEVPPEQWRCTMVESFYLGFAGSLSHVLKAIGLEDKDDKGKRLINTFSKPAPKNHKADWYDWTNKPEDWELFCGYCRQDVHVERQLWHWLQQFPVIPDWDYKQWFLDQRINDRGVPMDTDMAYAAVEMWDLEKQNLTEELIDMTGLPKVTRGPFLKWMEESTGVTLDNLRKDYLANLLHKGELPDHATPYVQLWAQKEGKATSKYMAVTNGAGEGDRARGMFQYKGASRTDRVGGRLIQLQNLKRPFVKLAGIQTLVDAIKCGDPRFLDLMYKPSVSEILGGAIRHVIVAGEGKTFPICDLSSIESVVLGWISQCDAIDHTFRNGRDSYKEFGALYFNVDYDEVTKEQRGFSKPPVLGCFAEDTLVLTDKGYVPIIHVTAAHRVFDGVDFVEHGGIIDQGEKEVIHQFGVTATPDHLFMLEEGSWIQFEDLTDVEANQATDTANGLLSNMWATAFTDAGVHVGLAQMCKDLTSEVGGPSRAFRVLIQGSHESGPLPLYLGCLRETMTDLLTDSIQQDLDVKTRKTLTSATMVEEELTWGFRPQKRLCSTPLPYGVGKTLTLKLIESIMTKGMSKGISVSLTGGVTPITPESTGSLPTSENSTLPRSSGESSHLDTVTKGLLHARSERGSLPSRSSTTNQSVKVRTYDILNAGPRNRFTILTNKGPMIVHNCGYMLGWKGLIAYAEGYGVDMNKDQAKTAVETFRGMYPEIPVFWKWIYDAVKFVTLTGNSMVGYRLRIERDDSFLRIWLPSGRALSYYLPEVKEKVAPWRNMTKAATHTYEEYIASGWDDDLLVAAELMKPPQMLMNFSYMGMNDKDQWVRIFCHAGGVTENIVQSIAGDLLWHGITEADKAGLPVILHVHDEIAVEVDVADAPAALDTLQKCMVKQPAWAQDMWLGADGFVTNRYTKD